MRLSDGNTWSKLMCDEQEYFDERAAIREYDGQQTPKESVVGAWADLNELRERVKNVEKEEHAR